MKNKILIQLFSIITMVFCFASFALAQAAEPTTTGGSFFSAENLIIVIVGGAASLGITQWLKTFTGAYGVVAFILAIVLAFVIAFVALLISSLFNGAPVDWYAMPSKALQLFALATAAYKLLLADKV